MPTWLWLTPLVMPQAFGAVADKVVAAGGGEAGVGVAGRRSSRVLPAMMVPVAAMVAVEFDAAADAEFGLSCR